VIAPDQAIAPQFALDADEAELAVRRELLSRCARRLHRDAVDADVAAVRPVWAALSAVTEELADDLDAAEIMRCGSAAGPGSAHSGLWVPTTVSHVLTCAFVVARVRRPPAIADQHDRSL
jgi:hypothetical protein